MITKEVVQTSKTVKLGKEWHDVPVTGEQKVEFKGRTYKVVSAQERSIPGAVRAGRGILGMLAVICTLGLALISKKVRGLFSEDKEVVRFIKPMDISSSNESNQNKFQKGAAEVDKVAGKYKSNGEAGEQIELDESDEPELEDDDFDMPVAKPYVHPQIVLNARDYETFLDLLGDNDNIKIKWDDAVLCLMALGFTVTPKMNGQVWHFKWESDDDTADHLFVLKSIHLPLDWQGQLKPTIDPIHHSTFKNMLKECRFDTECVTSKK